MSRTGLLVLRRVSKFYYQGRRRVIGVKDINLEIKTAELWTIRGASGSGKSTLLHLLGLLDRPDRGAIYLDNWRVNYQDERRLAAYRNQMLGFVFQQFNLLPRTSAWDNVMLPVWYNRRLSPTQARQRAEMLFRRFGLQKRRRHFPNQLSGGEQQRVAIIRALICDPKIILADEPTGNLDSHSGEEVIHWLLRLNREMGKTVIIVTHNPEIAKLGQHQLWLKDGRQLKLA